MAKYEVIKAFSDLQDEVEAGKYYVYKENDPFPRKGRAKKERIDELLGTNNKRGEALIKEVSPDQDESTKDTKESEDKEADK